MISCNEYSHALFLFWLLLKNCKLSFYCSFQSILRQDITIVGTRQWITLDDFVLPTASPLSFTAKFLVESGKFRTFERKEEAIVSEEQDVQQVLMWKEFARLARGLSKGAHGWSGETASDAESYIYNSISNQRVMDALQKSIQSGGATIEVEMNEVDSRQREKISQAQHRVY